MYNEYLRVAGLNTEGLMSEQERIERKRAFMAGIQFYNKFLQDGITRLKFKQTSDILSDTQKQLETFWKLEYKRKDDSVWNKETPNQEREDWKEDGL